MCLSIDSKPSSLCQLGSVGLWHRARWCEVMGAVTCLLVVPEGETRGPQTRLGSVWADRERSPVGVGTAACWLPLAPGAEEGGEALSTRLTSSLTAPLEKELRLRGQTDFRPQGRTELCWLLAWGVSCATPAHPHDARSRCPRAHASPTAFRAWAFSAHTHRKTMQDELGSTNGPSSLWAAQ